MPVLWYSIPPTCIDQKYNPDPWRGRPSGYHCQKMCLKAVSFLTRMCGYGKCYTRCYVQANTGETPVGLCIGNPHFLLVRDRFVSVNWGLDGLEGMVVCLTVLNYGFWIALFCFNERFFYIELFSVIWSLYTSVDGTVLIVIYYRRCGGSCYRRLQGGRSIIMTN